MAQLNHNRPCFQKNLAKHVPFKQVSFKEDPNHTGHELITVAAKRPHYGKLTCVTCNNKFVKWVGEQEFRMYKH